MQSIKARKTVPGRDTISVIASRYGLTPRRVRDIIRVAGAEVVREDGFRGKLVGVKDGHVGRPKLGWSDGQVGVDPATTKLTRAAIRAVATWKISKMDEE